MKVIFKLSFILILLVFLINACDNYQNPFQKKEKEEIGRGLRLSFERNTIPDTIYFSEDRQKSQDFVISVLVENFGPSIPGEGASSARLRIFDQIPGDDVAYDQEIEIPGSEPVFDNLGRIRGSLVPGRKSFPLDQKDKVVYYNGENIFDGARAVIHAELIIDEYKVSETFPLCIKEENIEGVPCSNNEVETFTDSRTQYRSVTYSPVTINRVEKTVTPLGNNEYFIKLDITLSNFGGGNIIGDYSDNGFTLRDNAINTPQVRFGRESLTCSPQAELVFVNNNALLNCVGTTTLEKGQEYVERITEIEYSFDYKMRISKGPIPIVKRK